MIDRVESDRHRDDFDLVEEILAGLRSEHVDGCGDCARRRDLLAAEMADEEMPFDEIAWRRQEARIRAAVAEVGRPWWRSLLAGPRQLSLAAAAAAAILLSVAAMSVREPMRTSAPEATVEQAVMSEEDLAGDELLREIDALLESDPYDFLGSWEG